MKFPTLRPCWHVYCIAIDMGKEIYDIDVMKTRIGELVIELIQDEAPASEVCFFLAWLAMDLGLRTAPASEHVFGLVLTAMTDALKDHVLRQEKLNSECESSESDFDGEPDGDALAGLSTILRVLH